MKTAKRLMLILMCVAFFSSMWPEVYAAVSISFDVTFTAVGSTLNLQGTTTAAGGLSAVVTTADVEQITPDNLDKILAVTQIKTEADGSFEINIVLPGNLNDGQYKVIIGGLGDSVPLADRTKTFSYRKASKTEYYLWIEGENYASVTGDYGKRSATAASAKSALVLDSADTTKTHSAGYTLNIPADDEYTVWVLGTPGNVEYVSKFTWQLDAGNVRNTDAAPVCNVYTTGDSRMTNVGWNRLASESLKKGSHSLTFACPEPSVYNYYYQWLDTIVVVPSKWEWTPSAFSLPYDYRDVSASYYAGYVLSSSTVREGSFNVLVSNKLTAAMYGDPALYARLMWKGEVVSEAVQAPATPMSKWTVNNAYQTTLTLMVPFSAPDGTYTVVCGIGTPGKIAYSNTENSYATVGTISVGSTALPDPDTAVFSDLSVTQSAGTTTLSGKYTLNHPVSGAKAYVRLYDGDVLWGVCEAQQETDTSSAVAGTAKEFSVALSVPEGIPGGSYTAEAGFYQINGTGAAGMVTLTEAIGFGYKPLGHGVFESKRTGYKHFWYINQKNTMIWDGKPYIPMGASEVLTMPVLYDKDNTINKQRWEVDMEELQTLKANGAKDMYIFALGGGAPTWVWQYIFDTLDDMGFNYGLQYSFAPSELKMMDTYYIRANSEGGQLAVHNVTGSGIVTLSVADSDFKSAGSLTPISAEYIVVDANSTVADYGTAQLTDTGDGNLRFSADISVGGTGPYTVCFTPFVKQQNERSGSVWEHGSEIIQNAVSFTQKLELGDHFRFYVDPIQNESGFYNSLESIRPYSEEFNAQYAAWLEQKYQTAAALQSAWGSDVDSFDAAAGIIPVYTSPKEGNGSYIVYCIDNRTGRLYSADGRNGVMWDDFLTFRNISYADFVNRLCDAIKSGTDVPVVVKNVWGHKDYFINNRLAGGLDGLGAEAYGNTDSVKYYTAMTYGDVNQFGHTSWLIVTETSTTENFYEKVKTGITGYASADEMYGNFNALYAGGAKGVFDFLFSVRTSQEYEHKAYAYVLHPEQFAWLENYRNSMDTNAITDYAPDSDKVYFMGEGFNYYTLPTKRTAVLYADSFKSPYQFSINGNRWLIPVQNAGVDAKVLVANFENAPTSKVYGAQFGAMLRTVPDDKKAVYMGFRTDLGSVPELDKYFTGTYAQNNSGKRVQILNPTETSQVLFRTANGQPWAIRDGNLWIVAVDDWCEDYGIRYLDDIGVIDASTALAVSGVVLSVTDGQYKAEASVYNGSSNTKTVCITIASYDSAGRLIDIKPSDQFVHTGSNSISVSIADGGAVKKIKTFVWESLTDLAPLAEAVQAEK